MSTGDLPFVTVIMPVFNEAAFIARSLGAALGQDYPAERMEVLVVDGRSSDATRSVVAGIGDPRVRLLDNPQRDQASALNVGIAAARGAIIVRVDGHCEIPAHYVRLCVETLAESGADNVGGQMRAVGRSAFARAVAAATMTPFATGGSRFHYSVQAGDSDTVYLGAFRREVFERAGLFDPDAVPNEDFELNYRLRMQGGRVYYNPEIWATYYVRPSLMALLRQYGRYGWRKGFIMRRHPGSIQLRHLVPPLFVMALLAALGAAAIMPRLWWIAAAIGGTYTAALLGITAVTAARHGWQHLPLLPVVFMVIHLSWGGGALAGLAASVAAPMARHSGRR
jgi:glycosyltransferase involved in cell wall biosynthesis